MNPEKTSHKEKGVALIFVLLIFAMITIMAVRIISDLHLNTEKTTRHLQYLQARQYALAAENYMAVLLEADAEDDKSHKKRIDHWHEEWAGNDQTLETDDGDITIMALDDQGRFNLNMLAGRGDKERLGMLIRLLAAHKIDAEVAYRIQDWVDDNQEPMPGGAEDATYLLLDPPYRTGDTAMVSVSELRLLDILSEKDFNKVIPLVSVLPTPEVLNMNTVTPGVLRALDERITASDAKGFVDGRSKDGFAEIKEVLGHPLLRGKLNKNVQAMITLKSHYFSVYIKARYRDMTYYLHSRLARDDEGKVTVISRETGQFPRWVNSLRESVR